MHIADLRQVPSGLFLTRSGDSSRVLTDGATPDEQALAAQHWAYSQQLLAQGTLVFAGRTSNRDPTTFAFAVIRASSPDVARALAEQDPAVAGGVFATEVYPFQPMSSCMAARSGYRPARGLTYAEADKGRVE